MNLNKNFIEDDKSYSRSGVIPFLTPFYSNILGNKLSDMLKTVEQFDSTNEFHIIFPQKINENFKDWGKNISSEEYRSLRKYNIKELKHEHRFLAFRDTSPTHMMIDIVKKIWTYIRPSQLFKRIEWDALIGIEPITSKSYEESRHFWDRNTFNYFGGKPDKTVDKNINDTAFRELREEGRIVFSDIIISEIYQAKIRKLYDISLPLYIDMCVNQRNNTYNRIFLLFVGDISIDIREDEKGKYLYIQDFIKEQDEEDCIELFNALALSDKERNSEE